MEIVVDMSFYWIAVAAIATSLAGFWGFKRLKSLFGR